MQLHAAQRIATGPNAGRWVLTGGNDRMGRYIACCPDATSPTSGHTTPQEAYAHMRERMREIADAATDGAR